MLTVKFMVTFGSHLFSIIIGNHNVWPSIRPFYVCFRSQVISLFNNDNRIIRRRSIDRCLLSRENGDFTQIWHTKRKNSRLFVFWRKFSLSFRSNLHNKSIEIITSKTCHKIRNNTIKKIISQYLTAWKKTRKISWLSSSFFYESAWHSIFIVNPWF